MARVWDRYLTESDKAHLAQGTRTRIGFGAHPALVLVDLYRAVFGDKREPLLEAIKRWPGSCGPAAWDAIPHIQRLMACARDVGIPVVHITRLAGEGVVGWGDRIRRRPGDQERRAAEADIIPELAPLPTELVLRKAAPSSFAGTALEAHLRAWDVDTLIIAGESTSGCVRATVVDAATRAFRTTVVEECVFDRHEAPHAINLFDMDQKYADVLSLAEVLDHLSSLKRGSAKAGR
jgi:nicotinamidase-related amidase